MPAYNAAVFIAEAIRSVIDQSYQNWELIVVNDGSADHTPAIVETFALQDKRVKLLNQENKGLGAARNAGMDGAAGQWIAFLDADDLWLTNKLQVQYLFIRENPGVDVLYADGYTLTPDAPIKLFYHFQVAKGISSGAQMYQRLFSANCIPVLSACVKKEWNNRIGGQNEETKGSEDWDYWLRLSREGAVFYGMSARLFIYRLHAGSMSARLLDQKLGSALVLLNNFPPDVLSSIAARQLTKNNTALCSELIRAGRPGDAQHLSARISALHAAKKGMRGSIVLSLTPFRVAVKSMMKKAVLKSIEFLFFRPYRKYRSHAHNLAIQYTRWNMGNRLQTKGPFFISRKASINVTAKEAKLITHGLHVNDFSQVNLSSDSSYFYTGAEVTINRFCHFNIWQGRLIIGNNVLFNNYCSINCMDEIKIGDNTWLGEGVRIYDHNHQYKDTLTPFTEQGMKTGKISVGDNCWIGSNTVVLQNVTIGDNCVIGANNLIYKSVPANTIVKANAMACMEQRDVR
jgi:teichuronic acid biosynthesis glycosyltransferase TuaG